MSINFSYPGKTTSEIAEAVDNMIAIAPDPSHVIIHTGTNNLPVESVDSCVAGIKSLVLKVLHFQYKALNTCLLYTSPSPRDA